MKELDNRLIIQDTLEQRMGNEVRIQGVMGRGHPWLQGLQPEPWEIHSVADRSGGDCERTYLGRKAGTIQL